jgi:hypothetical protein
MISNLTKIEIKNGERFYQFLCSVDSPIGEVHDALTAMKNMVVQRIMEADKPDEPKGESNE